MILKLEAITATKKYADQTKESLHMASRELQNRNANASELAARSIGVGWCSVAAAGSTLSLHVDDLTPSQFRALVDTLRWCGKTHCAEKKTDDN